MSNVVWLVINQEPFYRLGELSVDGKTIGVQKLSPGFLNYALPHIRNLTKVEGTPTHAKSVEVRLRY